MDRNERRSHVSTLFNALPATWTPLRVELQQMREQYVVSLVTQNSEEMRGRIKMIDDLLRLPETLRQEMNQFEQSLPE